MNKIFKYTTLLIIIVLSGCSTKKNTGLTRFYHGLTTKYNVLFNGTESYKEGINKYEKSYNDDYSQILPIFIHGNKELSASIKPQMDRTIEKSTKSIRLHSITVKPDQSKATTSEKDKAFYSKNEYNIFIDDSYLVMGKAFFYQADYASAIRIFNYIITQYNDDKTKYLAYNWLIRSNVQIKDFREAQDILDFLLSDMNYPEKLTYDLNLTISDFYLKQQSLSEAESYVTEALRLVKKKKEKTRLTFILAQIKEKTEKPIEASELYKEVIKLNPSYEMSFNAKIKRATLLTGGKFANAIKDKLLDMLKDDKNKEYLDQIYFALGNIEMNENNTTQAVEYYILSANASTSNTNQKALTYLVLANIFFDRANYLEAQAYFDSTVVFLDPDFPGYIELSIKNKYLGKLVSNLNEVKLQDSVQMVAKMTKTGRNAFIQKIIQDLREKEENELRRQREEEMAEMGNIYGPSTRPTTSANESGKWYFYNPSAKSFGEPEFKRKWGNRNLEDNWRRKNKRILGIEKITESEFSDEILDSKKGLDDKSPEYYLVDLPLTDSSMLMSHKKIQTALFNIGEIYRNDLKDYPLAIDAYKELIERYSESDYKVPAYYSIYKAYLQQENIAQSNVYKNMIIRNYPDSKYARVLVDPNFFKQFEQEELERKNHYSQTMNLYKQGNYSEVMHRSDYALNNYPESDYTAKYSYLKALAMGEIYGVTVLKPELEKIIAEYKTDPVAESSEKLLASIKENELKNLKDLDFTEKSNTATSKEDITKEEITRRTLEEIEKIYSYGTEAVHYAAIVISKSADMNQLRFNIINFNLDFYIQKSYDIESKEFNEFSTILTIKQFKNSEGGLEYYNKLVEERERVFKDVKSNDFQIFTISDQNLINLTNEKMVRDYMIFFRKNYQE